MKSGWLAKCFGKCEVQGKGEIMRILTLTVILGLPLMALGQTAEPQKSPEQTNETQTTAPAKEKKMRPAQQSTNPQTKSETDTNVRGQTNGQGRAQDVNRSETGARASTSQKTTVNKQECRSRHREASSLGRDPNGFF